MRDGPVLKPTRKGASVSGFGRKWRRERVNKPRGTAEGGGLGRPAAAGNAGWCFCQISQLPLLFACLNEPSRDLKLPEWVFSLPFGQISTINSARIALGSNHTLSLFPTTDQYALTLSRVSRLGGQEVILLSALWVSGGISCCS